MGSFLSEKQKEETGILQGWVAPEALDLLHSICRAKCYSLDLDSSPSQCVRALISSLGLLGDDGALRS